MGRHRLTADEPGQPGNPSVGPTPLGLLLASLASCTAITLRMYAERKYTDFGEIDVRVSAGGGRDRPRVLRRIHVSVPTSPEELEQLAGIADRTPVTLILAPGVDLLTELTAGVRGGQRLTRTIRICSEGDDDDRASWPLPGAGTHRGSASCPRR